MSGIQYSNVIARLLEALPDIRGFYERRSAELYARGNPHVIYGSVLIEYIHSLMKKLEGPGHAEAEQLLTLAFALIEELSSSADFETRCLAETSVIEALLGEPGGLERFAPYMGPETRNLARGVAQAWRLNLDNLS